MPQYTHIFFDLDHTLWDFEKNADECLQEIFETNQLAQRGIESYQLFFDTFSEINKGLWKLLDNCQITHQDLRVQRFKKALAALGIEIDEEYSNDLNEQFLVLLPQKAHLMDGAKDILDYLQDKYQLHIISNGYDDVQARKMKSSEIFHYFDVIATNEKANARKPHPDIFNYALQSAGATLEESLMVGDNFEADILGALAAGMDCVFYNPEGISFTATPTHSITHLNELRNFL